MIRKHQVKQIVSDVADSFRPDAPRHQIKVDAITPPNPYGYDGYYWPDGYHMNLYIKRVPKRAPILEIVFGDGGPDDKPLAFDKIRPMLSTYRFDWIEEDTAWGLQLKWVKTKADQLHNDAIYTLANRLLRECVRMEEKHRGPYNRIKGSPAEGQGI